MFEGLTGLPPPMHISCPEHLTRSVRRASGFVLTAQRRPTSDRVNRSPQADHSLVMGAREPDAACRGQLVGTRRFNSSNQFCTVTTCSTLPSRARSD